MFAHRTLYSKYVVVWQQKKNSGEKFIFELTFRLVCRFRCVSATCVNCTQSLSHRFWWSRQKNMKNNLSKANKIVCLSLFACTRNVIIQIIPCVDDCRSLFLGSYCCGSDNLVRISLYYNLHLHFFAACFCFTFPTNSLKIFLFFFFRFRSANEILLFLFFFLFQFIFCSGFFVSLL